jgi:hypothetical protein
MKVGRWIAANEPALASPAVWDYAAATRYVAALVRSKVGDYAADNRALRKKLGKPLAARSIRHNLASMRAFFTDCQEWGWIASIRPAEGFPDSKVNSCQDPTGPACY